MLSLELGLTDELVRLDDPYGIIGGHPSVVEEEFYRLCSTQIIGLAQHHGVPTPFIDWTRKPEVAVHFAAGLSDSNLKSDLAVYALNIGTHQAVSPGLSKSNILSGFVPNTESGIVKLPFDIKLDAPAKNSYLAAQHGVFTITNSFEKFFETGDCQPLEEAVKTINSSQSILKKFILPHDEISELRLLLDREGLTEAHLKPSLDTVATTIKSRWHFNSAISSI